MVVVVVVELVVDDVVDVVVSVDALVKFVKLARSGISFEVVVDVVVGMVALVSPAPKRAQAGITDMPLRFFEKTRT